MKKILGIIVVCLSVLLIYLGFKDNKIYYLSMGDGLSLGVTPYGGVDYGYSDYVKDFLEEQELLETFVNYSKNNCRTTDLINDINNNVSVNDKTLQNVLIKADLITLSIGNSELLTNLELNNDFGINDLSNRFDNYIKDLDALLTLLRKYSKERIVLLGFYDPTNSPTLKPVFTNLNTQIKNLCSKYDIIYIDTYNLFLDKNYIINQNNFYPSKEGYSVIGNKIIEFIELIFNK